MAEIKYLEINADDRSIIIPAGENLLGVENDNEGARKYFRCPKIVGDNIDLTKSDVYINVQNASGEKSGKDRYPVQNMTASGDNVTFEWVLERKVTSHKGSARFAVCVREKGTEREWHTTFATGNALEGEELFEPAELEARGQDFIGILTSDANADANSIESGKSAYVNGKKIEGALTSKNELSVNVTKTELAFKQSLAPGTGDVYTPVVKHTGTIKLANQNNPVLLKGNVEKTFSCVEDISNYGNAGNGDVRVGKTFTSEAGVKETGTLVVSEVKYGTITGKGMNSLAITTGLSDVTRFVLVRKFPSSNAKHGILALVYKDGKLSGIAGFIGAGYNSVDNHSIGTVAINKGTITYTPKADENMSALTEGDTYDWIAINE